MAYDGQLAAAPTRRGSLDSRVQRAIELVIANKQGPVTVAGLAQVAGLSVSYFAHLFLRDFGVSPARFVKDERIREAEELIRTTKLPLKEIFARAGVTDRSHFIRTFKRRYGLPPARYRVESQRSEIGEAAAVGKP